LIDFVVFEIKIIGFEIKKDKLLSTCYVQKYRHFYYQFITSSLQNHIPKNPGYAIP